MARWAHTWGCPSIIAARIILVFAGKAGPVTVAITAGPPAAAPNWHWHQLAPDDAGCHCLPVTFKFKFKLAFAATDAGTVPLGGHCRPGRATCPAGRLTRPDLRVASSGAVSLGTPVSPARTTSAVRQSDRVRRCNHTYQSLTKMPRVCVWLSARFGMPSRFVTPIESGSEIP